MIQRIFQDYQEGATIYGIAKWMTEMGVLNANGHPSWNHGSIGNLLKNPRYCGDEYYPPIISKELFQQVQERRANKASQLGRRYHPNSYANKGNFEWEDLLWRVWIRISKICKEAAKARRR